METNKEQDKNTQIAIVSLIVQNFELFDERVSDINAQFQISFDLQHQVNVEQKLFGLLLTVHYWTGEVSNTILKMTVENGFAISNLEDFVDQKGEEMQINMPQQLMAMLLDVSMHHTRALIADYTTNTKLEKSYLPLINPAEMLQQMQPA